jgi:hypothetical protein
MRGRRHRLPVTRLGRFARGRLPDRNPLRRASDRVETAVLALLVVAFLAGAPFAVLAAGSWAHAVAHRTQLAEQASWTQVTAVTVTAAPVLGRDDDQPDTAVRARWTVPDGAVATGEVTVPAGSEAGFKVRVWTSRDGQLTGPPLQDDQVSAITVLGEIGGGVAAAFALTFVGALARRALDTRRLAAWDAEWRSTGPRWTTRA